MFRFDDIQDSWLDDVQVAMLNLFISKNQSVTLGVIMNYVGNDSKIINKVREGDKKGLFELALHGWNHVDYTKLSEQEQKLLFSKPMRRCKSCLDINLRYLSLQKIHSTTIHSKQWVLLVLEY